MSQYQMTPLPSRDEPRPSVFAEARRALAGQPLRRAVVGYLMLLVALLPLPFGGWRDWAIDVMALLTAVMLIAVAWGALTGRDGLQRLSIVAVPTLLYALMLIWAGLQTSHFEFLHPWWNPVWDQAGAALGRPLSGSISVDRFMTWRGLVSLGSYGGVFLLAVYAVADLRVSHMLVRLFIYAASAYGLYGLVVYFTGASVVLWFDKEYYLEAVTGTFINRNNFAAYCGMALIAAVGLFLNEVSRRRQMPTKQAAIVIADRIWRMTWPLVVSAGILGTALLLTTSRGGAISTLVGLVGLCGVIFLTPRIRPLRLRGLLAVGLLIVGSLVVLSGDQTTQRIFTSLEGEEERFPVFIATVQAIRDFTVSGTGLGSFEDAFRLYRSADINGRFSLAHNDYLEAAMELGLPAAGAMLLAVLWLLGMAWRELRARRRGAIVPCIAVAVSLQLGFHSLLDFSMQVPAVVITYVTLLACALARADRDISADRPDDKRMGGRRPGKTKRSA